MPSKSANTIRVGRTIIMAGQRFEVTEVDEVDDPTLGKLVVLRCGDREFRRPPKTKIEVAK